MNMNANKRTVSTVYLQGLPAVSKKILLEKLLPVMKLHSVVLDDDAIYFQRRNPLIYDVHPTVSRYRMPFEQVVYIAAGSGYIDIAVRDGYVYILSVKYPARACLQFHSDIDMESDFNNQLEELTGIAHDTFTGLDEACARKTREAVKK
ncbi:hypothetical protein FACS189413_04010 [Bacteroidia bacterium]|nr:hypothetical protein FACS189413_04010 [Bacteroidia bacterium]